MGRLYRVITAAMIVGAAAPALAVGPEQSSRKGTNRAAPLPAAEMQTVRAAGGSIQGTVCDERGGPLSGVMVTALGATMAMALTDLQGRFSLALPLGEYVLRAHLPGFAAPRRELVRLGHSTTASVYRLQMRRLDQATPAADGDAPPVPARPIAAAGIALPAASTTAAEEDAAAKGDHPHNETAWRLRHIKRSILKDSARVVALGDADAPVPDPSLLTRTVDSAASLATAIFGDMPLSGEVNLLTTSAIGPGQFLIGDMRPRGVAYFSIGAPTPAGDWSVRTAMSEGDLSSWVVAGAFASRRGSSHEYNLALSYSKQDYQGGHPAALAAVGDGGRNAGEVQAWDRWSITPRISFEYGGRYAYYGYLPNRGLFSPRVSVGVEPVRGTRVTANVGQRAIAPGAEEFLPPSASGPWLPPERTFAPLAVGQQGFRIQRARTLELLVEQEFDDRSVLGIRRFYQTIDNQLVTLFALQLPDRPPSTGHYYVATAGAVDADGWALRWTSPSSQRVRASIDYAVTTARWIRPGELEDLALAAPSAVRLETEGFHDVTTLFETDIPETATRIHLLYKVNTAYSSRDPNDPRPGLDARFDVQVNQGLPFGLAGTEWEVLVGMRNVFRDPSDPGSVYDELLVVRPPKRVVGGFLVRF